MSAGVSLLFITMRRYCPEHTERWGAGVHVSGLGNGWPLRIRLTMSPVLLRVSMTVLRPSEYAGFGL